MKFNELDLADDLKKGVTETGYIDCLPVQEATLPPALEGIDICAQAQTGSGKTAAFLIPIFQRFAIGVLKKTDKALVIAPTRELALQIEEEAKLIGRHLGLVIGCFYGGVGYETQEKLIKEGVNLVIGTPGRLIDHMQAGRINFKQIKIAVIDEADRLFDMGFLPDIRKMMKNMVKPAERQTMLLSATLSTRVKQLAWEYMHEPEEILINPEQLTVDTISQELYHVARKEKMVLLLGKIRDDNPKNAIIFTNTKQAAFEVANRLQVNGYDADYIIGDLPQNKRIRTIEAFKAGKLRFLVATDVAARGLHVDGLDLVVNYDLPEDPESYVHRIGRTARVGNRGKSISLACEKFVFGLEGVEKLINMEIPVKGITDEDLAVDKSAGRRFRLERKGDRPRRDGDGRSRSSRPRGSVPGRGRGSENKKSPAATTHRPRKIPRKKDDRSSRQSEVKDELAQLNEFMDNRKQDGRKPAKKGGNRPPRKRGGKEGQGQRDSRSEQGQSQGQKKRRRRPPRKKTGQPGGSREKQPQAKPEKKSIFKKIFGLFGKK